MDTSEVDGGNSSRLLVRPVVKLRVAAACLALLGAGAWLAPAKARDPLSTPAERAAPLLEERSQLRAIDGVSQAIVETVEKGRGHAVRFASPAPPPAIPQVADVDRPRPLVRGGYGVRVADGRVLTHVDALPPGAPAMATATGERSTGTILAFEPATGLVLLGAAPGAASPPPLAPLLAAPGGFVVGVAHAERGDVAVPGFVVAADGERYAVAAAAAAMAPGLPLYDAAGALVAVAGAAGSGDAFAAAAVVPRLLAQADRVRQPASFGVVLQDRADALAQAYGPAGAIIADVVADAPAAVAGLGPGDLVLEVDSAAVNDAAAALTALAGAADRGSPAAVTVRPFGARQPRSVTLTPAPAFEVWRLARSGNLEQGSGPEARAVFGPAALEGAGVQPAARVAAIDGAPVTSLAAAELALRRRRPAVTVVFRDRRGRFVAAVETGR